MKWFIACVALSLTGAPLHAQSIDVTRLTAADGVVRDADYGLAFTPPPGWVVRQGTRWGDLEATAFFEIAGSPDVSAAIYYQAYYEPFAPVEGFAAWLKSEAERKARLRVRSDGLADYLNRPDSLSTPTIGGQAALSWVGDFTNEGRKFTELLTHVAGSTGHALVFVRIPAGNVGEIEPAYAKLIATLRLSDAAVVRALPPLVLEGRRLHRAKDYRRAFAVFSEAFKAEPIRAADLVVGAGAAAMAGESEVALRWLQRAVAKGWTMTQRLTGNADFASLRDLDGWKNLLTSLRALTQGESTVTDPATQAKLLAIYTEDQKYRRQLDDVEKKFGRDSKEIRELWATIKEKDAVNLAQVTAILDERGWLGAEAIGRQANSALFLVIQHSDHATQVKYLPMMRAAVKDGRAQASSLALLEDRVALADGRKQIYGSQIGREKESGKYYVLPLEDPDHVDDRRVSVGLPPLADYVKHWEITWDVAAYKQRELVGGEK